MESSNNSPGQRANQIIQVIIATVLLTVGGWLARRNFVKGNSDTRGALRLAVAVFVIEVAIWVCRDHYIPTLATFGRLVLAISTGLFMSLAMAMLYLALEPFVRRHWPQTIVSWSRLTTGRVRDALIGRDVLWGVTLGVFWAVVIFAGLVALRRLGGQPDLPSQALLSGGRQLVGIWLGQIVQCIMGTLQFFFVAFLLRVVLRNKWLAAAAFVAIFASLNILSNLRATHSAVLVPVWIVVFAIAVYAVTRFGLVTLAVAIFTANVLLNVAYTFDFSNWYATDALAVVLSFIAIAAWGFYASLGGQSLLKEDVFQ